MGLAKHLFAAYGTVPVYVAFFRWLGWGEQLDPMVEAWQAGDRGRALELCPEDLVREIFVFGTPEEMRERLGRFVDVTTTHESVDDLVRARRPEHLIGTVEEVAERLRRYEAAGVTRVMCQHLVHEDLDMVETLGRELAPAVS